MSNSTNLYRFRLDLSDVDRSVYETLDFRVAQHKSESIPYLLTRVLAFALNTEEGLQFSPKGLSEPEDPCISRESPMGGLETWIEVGNPSARRIHKAAKAARTLKIYTYKNPESLLQEMRAEKIHNSERIAIHSFDSAFLEELERVLDRDNEWNVLRDQDSIMITANGETIPGTLHNHSL